MTSRAKELLFSTRRFSMASRRNCGTMRALRGRPDDVALVRKSLGHSALSAPARRTGAAGNAGHLTSGAIRGGTKQSGRAGRPAPGGRPVYPDCCHGLQGRSGRGVISIVPATAGSVILQAAVSLQHWIPNSGLVGDRFTIRIPRSDARFIRHCGHGSTHVAASQKRLELREQLIDAMTEAFSEPLALSAFRRRARSHRER